MPVIRDRKSLWTWACVLCFAWTLGACEDGEVPDAGADSGTMDAGERDAGLDAGALDGGVPDSGADGGSGLLDPTTIPQFVTPLVIPPVMEPENRTASRTDYAIAARPFVQQVLPDGFPATPVWGYGQASDPLPGGAAPSSYHFPAYTIEARTGETVRVRWINGLMNEAGEFVPHLLPVDQTVHWANPPGPIDSETNHPSRYFGPVPIVTHVHGGHVPSASDGYPEAWFLPAATNIPDGYATRGTHFRSLASAPDGAAIFEYPLDQRATTLWYHDHTLGLTRLNVYAGLAGFFLVRDDAEDALDLPGPAPALGDAPGTRYYEIPIVIQDRSFTHDGALYYPDRRAVFDGFDGPFVPESEVAPIWNPEVFGTTVTVNGRTWPFLEVEPRLYRFRFLNGSNSRFLILATDHAGLVFHQIGNDGGLLPDTPVERSQLLLAPAERADVLVDFSGLAPGQEVLLLNLGPDEPYRGPGAAHEPADPTTTGRVMQFRVVAGTGAGRAGSVPSSLPPLAALTTTLPPRDLTLNEIMFRPANVPAEAELGTAADGPLDWGQEITETMNQGDTEIWRVANLTGDAHPIHLHLVLFEILDRVPFDAEGYALAQAAHVAGTGPAPVFEDFFTGDPIPPEPGERGRKDTFIARPGTVTRIIATFDLAGLYAWHCHVLEHEDNEMMRPFRVLAP